MRTLISTSLKCWRRVLMQETRDWWRRVKESLERKEHWITGCFVNREGKEERWEPMIQKRCRDSRAGVVEWRREGVRRAVVIQSPGGDTAQGSAIVSPAPRLDCWRMNNEAWLQSMRWHIVQNHSSRQLQTEQTAALSLSPDRARSDCVRGQHHLPQWLVASSCRSH